VLKLKESLSLPKAEFHASMLTAGSPTDLPAEGKEASKKTDKYNYAFLP
jgi:hypothetical protein